MMRILSALTLAATVYTAPAKAFTLLLGSQNQVTTGWSSSSVTFDIDTSCSSYLAKVYDAIDTASNTWGNVPTSSMTIHRGSLVTMSQPITTYVGSSATSYAPRGNPIIYCDANFSADSNEDANSIPGFAVGQNVTSSGELTGTLLVLNVQAGGQANINVLDKTLLGVVLTHEIGHCLGFGHSADPNALMYYATGAGRQVVLAQDDIDAVTYLYPIQEAGTSLLSCSSVSAFLPPNRRGGGPGGFFRTMGPDLALLGIFLLWVRRRRIYRFATAR